MKANHIIVVSETHWDREWYIPFEEYRARLVILMDKLLTIFKTDSNFKNFTLDGQTIPLEDYLEVRPEREGELIRYVTTRKLSIGPMYILPDEFLVSGESIIRNLLIGHKIAKRFGRVMKVGYIPDPFGHIAQLPQIISGFEIPSILFWRGFGDEFENNDLNIEFQWNAPGNPASVLGIFLRLGYGSVADLNLNRIKGIYKSALRKMKKVVNRLENFIITPIVLLNSGSDHHEARPELPEIIEQWNKENPNTIMEQNDFEYYVSKVLECKPELKSFEGELRGGKYAYLLSGVFSARMWIKQRNTAIEYLYEKYTEPLSTITWILDKSKMFEYPQNYILTGLKTLIKNHPHDSICGCSIDQVHEEMKTRFDWAEQIGNEVFKNSFLYLEDFIKNDAQNTSRFNLIVFNPLPWKRKDIVNFNIITSGYSEKTKFPETIKIIDAEEKEIEFQDYKIEEEPRYTMESTTSFRCSFLAEVPACGYKSYYVITDKETKTSLFEMSSFKPTKNSIENEFYNVKVKENALIDVLDKDSGILYEDICDFEDAGDWGDEYDFSGPKESQKDLNFTTRNANILEISPYVDGLTQKTLMVKLDLKLPISLSKDGTTRDERLIDNNIKVFITLYEGIKRIDFKIELENQSKDHKIRVIFPTKIKSDTVYADGHFYVVPRNVDVPEVKDWLQLPLGTNHQKDFVSIDDGTNCFAVLNKGLPEYEASRAKDGSVILAITLLRCIEWLSRESFKTRKVNAGPNLKTPSAQCIGKHFFELSLVIEASKSNWLNSEIHVKAKEFNCPLKPIFPLMARTPFRIIDKLIVNPTGVLSYFMIQPEKKTEQYLPPELSFLEIDNKNIVLSALKKSEIGNYLIVRLFNISSESQEAILRFWNGLLIRKAEIVNLLEENPINKIKAEIKAVNCNNLEIKFGAHVIATVKIEAITK